jgi:hypothetical protein
MMNKRENNSESLTALESEEGSFCIFRRSSERAGKRI